MAIDIPTPTTRRNVLAAAAGALVAFAAQAIGRPLAVRAEGEAVVVGGEYTTATSVTKIENQTNTATALWGSNTGLGRGVHGSSGSGTGVYGSADSGYGIWGDSPSGIGVTGFSVSGAGVTGNSTSGGGASGSSYTGTGISGTSTSGDGVYGNSSSGIAVKALSDSGKGIDAISFSNIGADVLTQAGALPAIRGWGTAGSTGVQGCSGPLDVVPAPAKTGVYGYAAQDAGARGVTGQSTAGRGVNGIATTGVGGYFTATTGSALRAEGAVRFKTSGLATIATGTRSVAVTPGIDLTGSSKILPSLQGDAGGSTTIQRVAVNTVENSFTIYLTANSVRAVKVSWFVIS
jgi:hypothetical protein